MSSLPLRLGALTRALLAPRDRLLPGVGRRVERYPRLAAIALMALRRLPGRHLRTLAYAHVSRPLVQLMSRELTIEVHGGARLRLDMGDVVGKVLATSGVWEPYVVAALERELAPGDVFADVGAHVGYHTLVASELVGPHGQVYAFEPSPVAYASLQANLELNAVSNVTAVPVAVGARDGYAWLENDELDNYGTTSVLLDDTGSAEQGTGRVEVRTLESMLDPSHIDRLRLVKIDVEGFEADVLQGVERLFADGMRPSVIVELHPHGADRAIPILEDLARTYDLRAYELARNPHLDRFAPVPPPRPIAGAAEMFELCDGKTTNVHLVPQRVSSGAVR